MSNSPWPYPGSRWWKFDFHTHTPASHDTPWHVRNLALSPEDWLRRYMAQQIDCVAITDHNSGAWIDPLKATYARMKAQADGGHAPEGFRELTLFPGVEISANGGVHVLAVFDPSATAAEIDSLMGAVGFPIQLRGVTDSKEAAAVTRTSLTEVIEAVIRAGAIPIPAHADAESGLLRVNPGTLQCALSAQTVKQALAVEGLLAVEWRDLANPYPEAVKKLASPLARVLGSDCHSFQGIQTPGSAYTWVKMARPSLEGLRLALLDGDGVSIRRSDEGSFDPIKTPRHVIRAIEIDRARVMGNGMPAKLELSPYFNAVVGGRGTGKSTVVHALRLATRREGEIQAFPKDSEPRERFESFVSVAKGRGDKGAIRPDTCFRVEWQHESARLRLNWCAPDGPPIELASAVEEWRDGQWVPSSSGSVNPNRFPVRLFSQGQIAAMAGPGRQALLAIIDEAAGVEALKQAFEEARRAFFAQRARLREVDGKLAALPEIERRLLEADGKLGALAQGDHAAVQQAFAFAQQQSRAVEEALEELRRGAVSLRRAAESLMLDDWSPQYWSDADAGLLAWRKEADGLLAALRQRLQQEATSLEQGITKLHDDDRLVTWRARAEAARHAHQDLQARLAAQGVADPQAFTRLTQERQQLEAKAKTLRQLRSDRVALLQQIETQQSLVLERRQAITEQRQAFLQETLAQNAHVRMKVVPFGFDPMVIEQSLRDLLEVVDDRFTDDILRIESGEARSGLAYDLGTADDASKVDALAGLQSALIQRPGSLGGHFRNFLERKAQRPEFADHVLTWFPQDDLRIDYQRGGRWSAISEGSQGQRSAALLAFLLAFGEDPIVLDQPEDDLDNHLIYDLIVRQIRENKLRRQLIVVTHNPNVVVNGDAELVHVMGFEHGQCNVMISGALQDQVVREEVCSVMEGGREAFARRWKRLGKEV